MTSSCHTAVQLPEEAGHQVGDRGRKDRCLEGPCPEVALDHQSLELRSVEEVRCVLVVQNHLGVHFQTLAQ